MTKEQERQMAVAMSAFELAVADLAEIDVVNPAIVASAMLISAEAQAARIMGRDNARQWIKLVIEARSQ